MRGAAATVIAFFGLALAPVALFGVDVAQSPYRPASLPSEFSRKTPREIEAWFANKLGYRSLRMRIGALAHFGIMHRSTSPWVVIGDQRWLFLADSGFGKPPMLSDFRGAERMSPQAVADFEKSFLYEKREAERCGIPWVALVAPNKQTIYGERLATAWPTVTRLDDLREKIGPEARKALGDVRADLLRLKSQRTEPLYNSTTSYWTELGAWAGYRHVVHALAAQEAIAAPERADLDQFDIVSTPISIENMDVTISFAREFFSDVDVTLVPRVPVNITRKELPEYRGFPLQEFTNPDGKGVLLYVGDAFSDRLVPLLARHFQKVIFMHWGLLKRDAIETYRPTAVVHEIVEYNISIFTLPPHLMEPLCDAAR